MYYIISTIILSYSLYIYHKYTEINVHTEKKDILLVCDAVYICGVTRKYNEIYNQNVNNPTENTIIEILKIILL